MAPDRLLAALLEVATAVGLETRSVGLRQKQAGPGGLCTIRGHAVVILNERASAIERSTALADALAGRTLDDIVMAPAVRGFIAARTRTRSRILLPSRRPGPGLAACRTPGHRQRRTER
ncbi:MAG TPA: hypothetical protein VER33_17185 [Polyangiaceae bacterium]|nr:hypothetical protein [Polyangiaceae bacterium]